MQILQPPAWARAKGFSNGIAASGRLVFIAGQIGWTGQGKWEATDFGSQFKQTIKNILEVLAEAGTTYFAWSVDKIRGLVDDVAARVGGAA